jgi:hypothetical protein
MSFVLFFYGTVRLRSVELRPLDGPILTSRKNKYGVLIKKIWTKEDRCSQKQSCYTANLSSKNPSWTAHILKQGPRSCMLATDPLDYGTALRIATVFRVRILC